MGKRLDSILAFCTVVLMFGCTVTAVFHRPQAVSEKENRELAQFPDFSFKSLFDGSFMRDFEKYTADQFPWRDSAVTLKADMEKLFGKKGNNGVHFGKDDYLISRPNLLNEDVLNENIESVKKLSEYTDYDITLCVVPTSFEILKDKLPMFAYNDTISREQQYINTSIEGTAIKLCDASFILSQHKDEYIYYRNDHHQTSLGSYYVYQSLGIGLDYTPYDLSMFERQVLTNDFLGTSWSKASISWAVPDTIEKFTLSGSSEPKVVFPLENMELDGLYSTGKLEKKDKYSVFLDGNHPLTVIESGNDTGRNLVIFKDSYAHSIAPFLINHFDTVHMVDLRYYNDDVIRYMGENAITDVLVLYNSDGFAEDANITKLGYFAETTDYFSQPKAGLLEEQEPVDDSYFADAAFLGDSLMVGYSYSANIPAEFVCKTSVNTRTVNTVTLSDGKTLMDTILSKEGIKKYYIMLGINEVGYTSPEQYKSDYRKIIQKLREKNSESLIYLISVLPIERSAEDNVTKEKIDAYNEVLLSLAEEENCYYLNAGESIAEPDGYLREGAASDGIHIGGEDHKKFEQYLKTHAVTVKGSGKAVQTFSLYSGGGTVDFAKFAEDMINTVSFKDNMSVVKDNVAARMFNLSEGEVLGGIVYTSGGGTSEEFAAFECATEDEAAAVKEKMEMRVSNRKADFDTYKPEEVAKLNNALIKIDGTTVFMCVSDNNDLAAEVIDKY